MGYTVNPEYFVRTKFSYVGDLWPFVFMKFPYSRWSLMRMKRSHRIRTHEIFVRKPPRTKYTKIKRIRNILDCSMRKREKARVARRRMGLEAAGKLLWTSWGAEFRLSDASATGPCWLRSSCSCLSAWHYASSMKGLLDPNVYFSHCFSFLFFPTFSLTCPLSLTRPLSFSLSLSLSLSLFLSLFLSLSLSPSLSLSLSLYLSLSLSFFLSLSLSFFLSLSLSLSLCLSSQGWGTSRPRTIRNTYGLSFFAVEWADKQNRPGPWPPSFILSILIVAGRLVIVSHSSPPGPQSHMCHRAILRASDTISFFISSSHPTERKIQRKRREDDIG